MASKQTEHYGLNQWAGEDKFIRAEFNEDNSKVDAALAGKAEQESVSALGEAVELRGRTLASSYMGNNADKRYISVNFPVKAVLLERADGWRKPDSGYIAGMAMPDLPLGPASYPNASVSGNGFYVYHRTGYNGTLNASGTTYYFVVFG